MNATLLYRIASAIYILFAAGHTFGSLNFQAPTPEGRAVGDSMNTVHFMAGGSNLSYGGFYKGFALAITVSILFNAFLAAHLGSLARTNPRAIGGLGWAFFAAQVVSIAISFMYFATGPAAFSAVTAILLGWAAWLVRQQAD